MSRHHYLRKIGASVMILTLMTGMLLSLPSTVYAAYSATDVLGQPDFTTGTANTTGSGVPNLYGLHAPTSTAIDTVHHRLFVADTGNHRVLEFNLDVSNNLLDHQADHFLTVFSNEHQGLAYDAGNNRLFVGISSVVYAFDVTAITDGENPINTLGVDTVGIGSVRGIAYDGTNERLFVADNFDNRVLVYNVDPVVLIAGDSSTDNPHAINVIGQTDYSSTGHTLTANGLFNPDGAAYDDANQRLFVTDSQNNRVMVYDVDPSVLIANNPATDGPDAINVIGAPDFTSPGEGSGGIKGFDIPQGVLYDDANQRLFVSNPDFNNRILVFDVDPAVLIPNTPATDDPDAINILGDSNTSPEPAAQNNVNIAWGMSYDDTSGNLYVADRDYNRVMFFNADPSVLIPGNSGTDDPNAVDALGQFDGTNPVYTTSSADNQDNVPFSAVSADGMSSPVGEAIDAVHHRLFVSDLSYDRVLEFDLDSENNLLDHTADHVLGPLTFTEDGFGLTQSTFNGPNGLAYDAINDRLFVVDPNNNRVMVFDVGSIADGEDAINVIGQSDFTHGDPGTTQNTLQAPDNVAFDGPGERLFVSDGGNNRVMVYDVDPAVLIANNPSTDGPNAVNELGHTAYDGSDTPVDENSLVFPNGLAYDATNERLFVGDFGNQRIMVFNVDPAVLIPNDAGTDGPHAIHLLGHTAYDGSDTPTGQNGFISEVAGVAYDATRNRLFVSDDSASRITVFDVSSITDGEDAVAVIGQDDFNSSVSDTTQDTLNGPEGLAYDSTNNRLYVADTSNNRVMIFDLVQLSPDLSDGALGAPYDQTISADNVQGTTTFAVTAGSLPTGLSLDTSTGELSGTPTALGSFSFTVMVTDDISPAGSFSDSHQYTLTIGPGPYVASDVLGQLDADASPSFTQQNPNSDFAGLGSFNLGGEDDVVVDAVHHRLFANDSSGGTNRVLEFDLDSNNKLIDQLPDHVLGQPDLFTEDTPPSPPTASSMYDPRGVAYDSGNNLLFVADHNNGRVLVFDVASITDNEDAVNVLGKANFTDVTAGASQTNMDGPTGVAYESSTHLLYVSDQPNSRVLVFDVAAISDGEPAVHVLGQTNFTNSSGSIGGQNRLSSNAYWLEIGSNHILYVTDGGNNRVLIFDVTSISDGENAVHVLGQTNFSNHGDSFPTPTASTLRNPRGIVVDDGGHRLFVSDAGDNRILIYDITAISDGEAAVHVLGQSDFSSLSSFAGVGISSMSDVEGMEFDPTTNYLYATEPSGQDGHGKIIVFDVASITDGENAIDLLIDPVNSYGFDSPYGLTLDSVHHRLFIADFNNNRVLEFDLDSDNNLVDHVADHILGQIDFKSKITNTTQNGFSSPSALAYDSGHNRLFVTDQTNNRVMVFDVASITDGENAINVIGHSAYDNGDSPGVQAKLGNPAGLAYDAIHDRLFVADQDNSRVMVFNVDPAVLIPDNAGTDGPDAINELGHTAYDGGDSPTNQNSISDPLGIAYDSTGEQLFVSDDGNARVMVFNVDPAVLIPNDSGTDGPDAVHLLGHSAYDGSDTPTGQNGIPDPQGLTLDNNGTRLFVADANENRVLMFDVSSITDGEDAIAVLGQPNFSTTDQSSGRGGLSYSPGTAYDNENNRLYVVDLSHSRVLIYNFIQNTTAVVADGTTGEVYHQDFTTINDQGDVSFSLVSGSLPPGLTVGSIDGTPTTPGDYTFTIRAIDDNGDLGSFFDDRAYTMTITGDVATPTPTPTPQSGGGGGAVGGNNPPVVPSGTPAPSVSPGVSVTPSPFPSPSSSPAVSPTPEVSGSTESPVPSDNPISSPTPPDEGPSSGGFSISPVISAVTSAIGSAVSTVFTVTGQVLTSIVEDAAPIAAPITALALAVPVILAGVAAAVSSGSPVGFVASQSKVLLEVIGLKRRRRIWGTIYDARTKRPIPYAKVELYDQNRRLLETRYADRDGRYGFLTSAQSLHQGSISVFIIPSAPKYQFPSKIVTKDSDFIVYDHLYHGGSVAITKDSLVNYNIALDPTTPGATAVRVRVPGIISSLTVTALDALFWIGLILLPLNAIFHPSLLSIGFLALFLISNGIRITSDLYRPYGLITDTSSHTVVPYALITLNDPNGTRKSFAVSDEQGRYFLITDPGSYLMTTHTPAQIQPPRTNSVQVKTKKGWIRTGLRV